MANTHPNLSSLLTDIADAIRTKTGGTSPIVADTFPTAISNIPGKLLATGTITPTVDTQNFTATHNLGVIPNFGMYIEYPFDQSASPTYGPRIHAFLGTDAFCVYTSRNGDSLNSGTLGDVTQTLITQTGGQTIDSLTTPYQWSCATTSTILIGVTSDIMSSYQPFTAGVSYKWIVGKLL